jgi:hypothetical protein
MFAPNRVLVLLAACTLLCGPLRAAQEQLTEQPTSEELVDAVLDGESVPQGDALELLIRRIVEPYRDAVGDISDRPVQQRLRLQETVREINAELRLRTLIAELPQADRALAEQFAAHVPKLARGLFYESPYDQEAILDQLPLEPGTGASVLVATLVFDVHESVAAQAARVAARLNDDVVARNLCRGLRDVMTLVDEDYFKPGLEELELVLGQAVYRAIGVLGEVEDSDCTPLAIRAAEHFTTRFDPRLLDVSGVFAALGELGDERAAPLLLKNLDVGTVLNVRRPASDVLVVQSVGDAALYGLVRLYGLEPQAFGFVQTPGRFGIVGFKDEHTRREAHARFRRWHQQNADKPPAERAPATRPAGDAEDD